MRQFLFAPILVCLALPGWSAVSAEPGTEAERISRAPALDNGMGAVAISIRSELYLDDPLQVYFLREGGSITNDVDVIRFERRQGFFALGNDTTTYQIRTFQVQPGTYRLAAHGMNCPKVPAQDERCLVDVRGIGGVQELSRPSRGYSDIAPSFEVRAGAITYAGDFALTARNTLEWSEIPHEKLERTRNRFETLPVGPQPAVPGEFRLKYSLHPRTYEDDAGRRY